MPLPFTCITCRVSFIDADTQRAHYKTDWHRYNLKRKVADLAPVTSEAFQQRVLSQRAKIEEQEKETSTACELCSKHFSSKNAFENHIKSKKHKEAMAKEASKLQAEMEKKSCENTDGDVNLPQNEKRLMKDCVNMKLKSKRQNTAEGQESDVSENKGEKRVKMDVSDDDDSDIESCDNWDENSLGIEECLFCSRISASLEDNIKHMTSKHSFFLPDAEYIVDLEGLITYLGEKVGVGHVCLWCNTKGKSFLSTQAVQKHMLSKGHCKMLHDGDAVFEYADFYDYRTSYPDFEGGGSNEEVDPEADMELDEEDEVEQETVDNDGYELVLPSGATVGHRSLQRYYKQNLPHRQLEKSKSILPKMLAQYKALGWTGTTGEVAQKRVKDLAYMQRMKTKHYMGVGVRANKLQKHFRSQILF